MDSINSKLGMEILEAAKKIACDAEIDDYGLWRSSKDIDNEYFQLVRSGAIIPIEIVRLHRILSWARMLRDRMGIQAGSR